ncbi:MAG: class I SAM-dependent methyltransferase [Candidatus Taylorbacteria bacterium]
MNKQTDWDRYYNKPYKTASFTRKITGRVLLKTVKRFYTSDTLSIIELGGGNSCFCDLLMEKFNVERYDIVDSNQLSINLARNKSDRIHAHLDNVLTIKPESLGKADLVYSVGLIEHFSIENTKKAIETHFALVKDGGLVMITFPTPTFLYKTIRYFAELFRMWIFHDERPLQFDEVAETCIKNGEIVYRKIIWPILLTQYIVVVRKSNNRGQNAVSTADKKSGVISEI